MLKRWSYASVHLFNTLTLELLVASLFVGRQTVRSLNSALATLAASARGEGHFTEGVDDARFAKPTKRRSTSSRAALATVTTIAAIATATSLERMRCGGS